MLLVQVKMTPELIASKIYFIRGEKVLLDADLALLNGVGTKVLKQAVRRNIERFPADFLFELSTKEWASLRSQIVTLEIGRGKYSKYPPFAFTEQGVAMLSGILNSSRAIKINIVIMRTFVALRKWIPTKNWRTRSANWKANTTSNSKWSLMQSVPYLFAVF